MLAFPGMIAGPAREAGIKVPSDDEMDEDYDVEKYPHFAVFCNITLGVSLTWGTAQDWMAHNAKMIAAIPDDKIMKTTFEDLRALGWWESC